MTETDRPGAEVEEREGREAAIAQIERPPIKLCIFRESPFYESAVRYAFFAFNITRNNIRKRPIPLVSKFYFEPHTIHIWRMANRFDFSAEKE